MNIYQKLVEVRKSVPYIEKDSKGYQFKYTSSSQVLTKLRTAMDEHGLLLIPRVLEYNLHMKDDTRKEYMTELSVEFTWVNADNPEEKIVCPWYGQGLDTGEKGVGKALTYSEKYFLLKFFNIATDSSDPDAFQNKDEPSWVNETGENEGDKHGSAKDVVISFGKYNGMTLGELLVSDRGYVIWLSNNSVNQTIREAAKRVLEEEESITRT